MMAIWDEESHTFMVNAALIGPLLAVLWTQAWLTLPWLTAELSLPAPLSHLYVWSKVWAVILLPAAISLLALLFTLAWPRKIGAASVVLLGWVWDTLYLWHHIPNPAEVPVLERWVTALLAVTALIVTNRTDSAVENAAPALQILSGLTLVLAFVAPAHWALIVALAITGGSGAWALRRARVHTPSR